MIIFIISKLLLVMYGIHYDQGTVNGFAFASGLEFIIAASIVAVLFPFFLDAIKERRKR